MIGVVVLNYNDWKSTLETIISIINSEKQNSDFKIVLVDNHSSAILSNKDREFYDKNDVTLIFSDQNLGYSAGNNLGIRYLLTNIKPLEGIFISNNDVIVSENCLSRIVEYSQRSKIDIIGPKIKLANGSLQRIEMGIKSNLKERYFGVLNRTFFSVFLKKFRREFFPTISTDSTPFKVHSVSGCFFYMNRKAVEILFPLDEHTFLYMEEFIIGVKAEKNDLSTVYFPKSEIIHYHGKTTAQISAFSYIHFVKSEIYYLRNYVRAHKITIVPLYFIRVLKYLVTCIFKKQYRKMFYEFFSITVKELFSNEKLGDRSEN